MSLQQKKIKKPSKSYLTNKLDKECSRIIRSSGECYWCKCRDYEKLQCAHIFSRTYRNTRWDLNNLICLCARCHFQAHKQPTEFTDLVKVYLGEDKYFFLKCTHYSIKRWTVPEMQELLATLQEIK